MVIAAGIWGIVQSPKMPAGEKTAFQWAEAKSAIWSAKWELLLPVVACVALFSGLATAVEASAITALYAFVVESLVYRDLSITRDLPRVMKECGLLVGAILLILGVALGFTGYLIQAQVPEHLIAWVQSSVHSPLVFLLALNVFLLIVGCLMDIFSAIIVVVPLMVPIGAAFGINPVHLGIIFLANLELGYLTPPVGMNLFPLVLSFQQADARGLEVHRSHFACASGRRAADYLYSIHVHGLAEFFPIAEGIVMNVADEFTYAALYCPDKKALIFGDTSYTYAEMHRIIEKARRLPGLPGSIEGRPHLDLHGEQARVDHVLLRNRKDRSDFRLHPRRIQKGRDDRRGERFALFHPRHIRRSPRPRFPQPTKFLQSAKQSSSNTVKRFSPF